MLDCWEIRGSGKSCRNEDALLRLSKINANWRQSVKKLKREKKRFKKLRKKVKDWMKN